MPAIDLKLDGPESFTPIPADAKVHHVTESFEVALVLGGMQSGAASVMLQIRLPDGSVAIVETSLALWETAARAMRGRIEYLATTKGRPS